MNNKKCNYLSKPKIYFMKNTDDKQDCTLPKNYFVV
jgi:hypothetical protein